MTMPDILKRSLLEPDFTSETKKESEFKACTFSCAGFSFALKLYDARKKPFQLPQHQYQLHRVESDLPDRKLHRRQLT